MSCYKVLRKKTNNKALLLLVVLSKPVSFLGYPSGFLIKCFQICYCFHFPVFSVFRSDTVIFEVQDAHDSHVVFQEPSVLNSSSRDWRIGERDTRETPWKLTASSPTHYSGTLDYPHSGGFLGSRSRLVRSVNVQYLEKNTETPGFYFSLLNLKSCQQGLSVIFLDK